MASAERKDSSERVPEKGFPWHLGVFDAHCHPANTMDSLDSVPLMKARALTVMASRAQDQQAVAKFAETYGMTRASVSALLKEDDGDEKHMKCQIVPSFGWHPWYSHQLYDDSLSVSNENLQESDKICHYKAVINPEPSDDDFLSSLPDPQSLSSYLAQTRGYLEKFQYALVGEIGLDSAFRIPDHRLPSVECEKYSNFTPGGRQGRRLTSYRVNMHHQRAILKAQLHLAAELLRAVSVHGVAAHGAVFEVLKETWKGHEKKTISKRSKQRASRSNSTNLNGDEMRSEDQGLTPQSSKPFPPRICLHSYSGSPDLLKQYFHPSVPAVIYFSFSRLVNFSSTSSKAVDVIKVIPDDRILVESDFHCAGQSMDDLLEKMVESICLIKSWCLEEGVQQLASNWLHFVFGERHRCKS